MTVALNRTQGRAADDGGMFASVEDEMSIEFDADAQEIIGRLGAQCCPLSTIDTVDHALRVAAVVLKAKRHPLNPYAEPTLT